MRWVWNSEDYVWTEVFSEHQRRWVHVDACEGAWDQPRLYTEGELLLLTSREYQADSKPPGWGRKIAYCIAFSIDGATDVTRRYVRSPTKHGMPRTRAPEEVLLWVIQEIRKKRRQDGSKIDMKRLMKEDEREERELRAYMASGLAAEINNLLPQTTGRPDEQKIRQEAGMDWLPTSQAGSGYSGPDRSPGGR